MAPSAGRHTCMAHRVHFHSDQEQGYLGHTAHAPRHGSGHMCTQSCGAVPEVARTGRHAKRAGGRQPSPGLGEEPSLLLC